MDLNSAGSRWARYVTLLKQFQPAFAAAPLPRNGLGIRALACRAPPQKQDSVLATQASARARRKALSRALRLSVAAELEF
jgi:hypothetical protein